MALTHKLIANPGPNLTLSGLIKPLLYGLVLY